MTRQEDAWTMPRNLDEKLVDIEQSYRWLKSGDIKGETIYYNKETYNSGSSRPSN